MSARIAERQAEVLTTDGGATVAWLPVSAIAGRSDLGAVYRGVTLYRCRNCGRRCSGDCVRCHCGEAP